MIPAPQSTNSDSAWGFHRGSGWAERTKNGAGRADTAGRARSNEGDIDATITLVNLVLCRHRCVPQGAAAAQIYEPVTARQLLQNPTRYLGYRIELTNAYCASIESGKYECTTSEPLVVRTGNVATPDSRKIMEEECGGLDTTELNSDVPIQSPFCSDNHHVGARELQAWHQAGLRATRGDFELNR